MYFPLPFPAWEKSEFFHFFICLFIVLLINFPGVFFRCCNCSFLFDTFCFKSSFKPLCKFLLFVKCSSSLLNNNSIYSTVVSHFSVAASNAFSFSDSRSSQASRTVDFIANITSSRIPSLLLIEVAELSNVSIVNATALSRWPFKSCIRKGKYDNFSSCFSFLFLYNISSIALNVL